MADSEEGFSGQISHLYLGNIPKELRSADLRAFFSQFIESKAFHCFHFRHRPEEKAAPESDSHATACSNSRSAELTGTILLEAAVETERNKTQSETCCCIIQAYENRVAELMKTYNRVCWLDRNNKIHSRKVALCKIRLRKKSEKEDNGHELVYRTRKEMRSSKCKSGEDFFEDDLTSMPELNPPPIMPNGNVGTPLSVFVELIKACKFPSNLISKLDLQFPKSFSSKRYGTVSFDYKNLERYGKFHTDEETGSSDQISKDQSNYSTTDNSEYVSQTEKPETTRSRQNKGQKTTMTNHESEGDFGEDHEAEDWERHEALHDDVTQQDRTKERLYEEDIELKWEKGGPGLVFYTDAYYWHEMSGKDFDEQTADDWDVDMSVYYEPGSGDKDSKDLLEMRIEERRKRGVEDEPTDIVEFEKHNKGFGSKQLHKHGWRKGSGVGSWKTGISEPVEAEGQKPFERKGLGYYGEKLNRNVKRPKRRAERDVIISTVYDEKDEDDNVFRNRGPHTLKYKDMTVDFIRGQQSKES